MDLWIQSQDFKLRSISHQMTGYAAMSTGEF